MKLKIYSLFLLIASICLTAQKQTSVTLQFDTSGYAENSISKPGSVSTQKLDPNENLIPTVFGEMNVNEGGTLNYTIPIETVKGINDHHPNVAIAYNSQGGNGQAGWGWNVTGISTISQGGKSKEIDGVTIGPQFNSDDPYYLDGQRLIKINDTSFATEKYSKVKITKPASGEFSFIIQYTDGKIAKYKEFSPGQHYIVQLSDAMDNQIHYSYDSEYTNTTVERKNMRLAKISYGGTDAANDPYYISIVYKMRKGSTVSYRNGLQSTNQKIIDYVISGTTSTGVYRKYSLTYDMLQNNTRFPTERLRKVVVENGVGDKLKPLNFNYNTSTGSQLVTNSYMVPGFGGDVNGLGTVAMGDFFEAGKLEPVYGVKTKASGYRISSRRGTVSLNYPTSGNSTFHSAKVLFNNKISLRDALIGVTTNYVGDVNSGGSLVDEVTFHIDDLMGNQSRTVKINLPGGTFTSPPDYDHYTGEVITPEYLYRDKTERTFHTGDFNNDGLMDFLIFESANDNRPAKVYLVEVSKIQTSTTVPIEIATPAGFVGRTYYNMEFDGDGIPEILGVNAAQKSFSVYKLDMASNVITTKLANVALFGSFTPKTPLFIGDFNGDGLSDFMAPAKVYEMDPNAFKALGSLVKQMETQTNYWYTYLSKGNSFTSYSEPYNDGDLVYAVPASRNIIKRTSFWDKFWNGEFDEYKGSEYINTSIIMADFNGDGRTDIITSVKIGNAKYTPDELLYKTTVTNLGNSVEYPYMGQPGNYFNSNMVNKIKFLQNGYVDGGSSTMFRPLPQSIPLENITISPLSLILAQHNFNQLNTYTTGLYIYDPLLKKETTFEIKNDNFLEKQIQEVDNGSSVLQRIEYRPMVPNYSNAEVVYNYKPDQTLNYPYYTHNTNGSYYLVNKIHTVFDNKILTKEYRFENGIQHLEGKGFMGFQKIYMSDPYESEFKNNKYANKNPVKPLFWNITTKDPLMENAVVLTTYGGLKKFINETQTKYKKFDKGNHQYLILDSEEISKDNLKNITISKKYDYDEADGLKLKSVFTDYNGIGSSLTKYNYKPEFFNGDHYLYGKFASIESITYKDGLSFSTKEETDYAPNGNLSQKRKFGNDPAAQPIVTNYTYNSFGNLESESLSTTGVSPQTTSYEYDTTNRYIRKTTTPEGLSSQANVNIFGQVASETTPMGLVTSYIYDTWGNATEITDYLGKKTTLSKSVSDIATGARYNLHKKREGGTETVVTFDKFDREIQNKTQSINGKWLVVKTEYDLFGRKSRYSEPFFEGEAPKWNSIEYDEMSRPVKNTAFTGKVMTTCYEGMKVTVDDGYKKTSKTIDAMGHVVRHQDHGGVVAFSYYPNGAIKESNYEGIKTTYEIDGWGNKKKESDPTAGTFTYEYDNLSRITKETNPKGYTLYTYDSLGRPETEKTYGNSPAENTNIEKTYTYNGQTKLPQTVTGTSNGKQFIYTSYYDQYYRLYAKTEETPDFTYSSADTYDSYGRVDATTISTIIIGQHLSTSTIKNVYDANGILVQQNDADTNTMVWHLSDINAKGQYTQMEYGNGYSIANQYNPSDFSLFNIKHQNTNNGTVAVDIDYNYDVNKGVLNWRRNNSFGNKEEFTYDTLNRLLSEAVNGVITNQYTYDKRGRITSNSELGKYNYNETDYKLQSVDFNTNGKNVNTQRGFAKVSYNAFRSPNSIALAGKDVLRFEYNILASRYSMTSKSGFNTKYYSSDFGVEITKNTTTGVTEIITYLNGDPYTANYIKKEVVKNGNLIEKNKYYLHRDNLNSIVAITKADGSVVEKRFFDAWGNLKGLVKDNGQVITNADQLRFTPLFISRGYTGHEHLQSVGLINMNARIYDPVVRKFLSADTIIPDKFNTQSYDRFGYAYNNPLLYIDVNGYEAITLGAAVLIGLAVAITTKVIMNMINGIPFWYGLGKAAVMGAFSGAISFGIGSMATSIFGQYLSVGKSLFEAAMHASTGGFMSVIDGGKFGSGALSGAVSSLMASGIQSLGIDFAATRAGGGDVVYNGFGKESMKAVMLVSGGLSGGISAAIAGGNFWQGFRQGLISAGLNHLGHLTTEELDKSNYEKLKQQVEDYMLKEGESAIATSFTGKPEDLIKLVTKVPILNELFLKIKPGTVIWFKVTNRGITPLTDDKGNRILAETYKNTAGTITINLEMIKSDRWMGVALTMGHELIHAANESHGLHALWASYVTKEGQAYAKALSEQGAYNWEAAYSGTQKDYDTAVGNRDKNTQIAQDLFKRYGR
ncbi:RHS repeat-associated core domain-containing protein [Chryseobacterium sp. Tr-659]|uniref:RHS repeat-associated core domain-containing protein n=1 Tax=Chryseobacterium sp. Tr-659 TaxID=2608340 RepID=UPI00141EA542|nr:RHS repeat-associated core domain-containing protein [Chryseobacterium sp. Tr-659]